MATPIRSRGTPAPVAHWEDPHAKDGDGSFQASKKSESWALPQYQSRRLSEKKGELELST